MALTVKNPSPAATAPPTASNQKWFAVAMMIATTRAT